LNIGFQSFENNAGHKTRKKKERKENWLIMVSKESDTLFICFFIQIEVGPTQSARGEEIMDEVGKGLQ